MKSSDRSARDAAQWVLRAALLLECAGALGIAVRDGLPWQQVGAALALVCAVLVVRGGLRNLAWGAAVWFAASAVWTATSDVDSLAPLAVFCQASRIAVPVVVAQPAGSKSVLRVATSLTFVGHGIEALCLKPIFLAYLLHVGEIFGLPPSLPLASALLQMIGVIDIVLAIAVWQRFTHGFAIRYMTGWGMLTALVRTLHGGVAGVADTLIRAANGGVPLVLWLHARQRERVERP